MKFNKPSSRQVQKITSEYKTEITKLPSSKQLVVAFDLYLEALKAKLNTPSGYFNQIGNFLERVVIRWQAESLGLFDNIEGTITADHNQARLVAIQTLIFNAIDSDYLLKQYSDYDYKLKGLTNLNILCSKSSFEIFATVFESSNLNLPVNTIDSNLIDYYLNEGNNLKVDFVILTPRDFNYLSELQDLYKFINFTEVTGFDGVSLYLDINENLDSQTHAKIKEFSHCFKRITGSFMDEYNSYAGYTLVNNNKDVLHDLFTQDAKYLEQPNDKGINSQPPIDGPSLSKDSEALKIYCHMKYKNILDSELTVNELINQIIKIGEFEKSSTWQSMEPFNRKKFLNQSLEQNLTFSDLQTEIFETILPFGFGNTQSKFYGWYVGSANPASYLLDPFKVITKHKSNSIEGAKLAEHSVISTIQGILNLDSRSSHGYFTSGGSESNQVGILTALNQFNLANNNVKPLVYVSESTHFCIKKVLITTGIGADFIRVINVNKDGSMDTNHLNTILQEDSVLVDCKPAVIVANFGTTGTGVIDDIARIHTLASEYNSWLHIDGAYGWSSMLSESIKNQHEESFKLADSIAGDLHKWFYTSYCSAFVLFNKEVQVVGDLELRAFDAIKTQKSLEFYGLDPYKDAIESNLLVTQQFCDLISQNQTLELLTGPNLGVVNFRYINQSLTEEELNDMNALIIKEIQSEGEFIPSNYEIDGKTTIRVAILHHSSTIEELKDFITAVVEKGNQLVSE